MQNVAHSVRVQGRYKNSFTQFQRGFIISSQYLLDLYTTLKERYEISYILTCRLDQGVIEHFVGCLRHMRLCNQHPSSVDVKHRMRNYLLGKSCDLMGPTITQKETVKVFVCHRDLLHVAVSKNL